MKPIVLARCNRTVRLVHADLPFAEEIKTFGCFRNTTKPALIANRTILSA
jgi:hypothetical protein